MRLFFFTVMIAIVLFFSTGQTASAAVDGDLQQVEAIQVEIHAASAPPPQIVKRMSESVRIIGEHIMLGRRVIDIAEESEKNAKLVRDVFDRVLIGYTVEKVQIEPAQRTLVHLYIVPWGDTVRDVKIQVDYSGISPEAIPLIQADMGKIEEQIQSALLGLPVDAVDWASGVARDLTREILSRQLPEFHFSLDVAAGKQTAVRLSMFPTGPVVKEANVVLRSGTIPNLLLVHARPALDKIAESMHGLPVAYLERRSDVFREKVRRTTAEDPLIRQFGLKVTATLQPGIDTVASVLVEAQTWRIMGEAYVDVGQSKDNISGMAHVGRRWGAYEELFVELKVMPGTMTWEVSPGWGHQFGSNTWSGVRYRTNDKEFSVWLNQGLGGRWSVRAERWPNLNWNEVGVRYKLHDFLSVEFLMTNQNNWLRLVGHL